LSTKLHIAVDALGNPLRVLLTPGQRHEATQAEALIAGLPAEHVIGDMAFDNNTFRAHIAARGSKAVIPSKPDRVRPIACDYVIYKERHLVECFINKLKHFRRVATRYDKTAVSFLAFTAIASFMVWLR
jgi:transposase